LKDSNDRTNSKRTRVKNRETQEAQLEAECLSRTASPKRKVKTLKIGEERGTVLNKERVSDKVLAKKGRDQWGK